MLIPLLIFCFLSLLTLAISLRGRRIDTHPTCRRCKFDLINLPSTICPECGANLEAPKAIRIGNRQRLRRLALFSCFLLLIGAAGSGLSIYGTTRTIDWYTYKPVWWLRLEAKHGSQESVTHAINELLARNDNNKLTQGDRDAISSSLMSALESAHLPNPTPYGHALSELLTSGPLSESARDQLITWLLKLQTDPTKPWSTELGNAFLAECLAKRLPAELMTRFLEQTCSPQLSTLVKRPLRPGESTPIVLNFNARGGNSSARLRYPGALSGSAIIGREGMQLPAPGIAIVGNLTAPQEPGSYTFDGTILASLGTQDPLQRRISSRMLPPTTTPEAELEWQLHFSYQVAASTPVEPLRDFASRMFIVGSVEPEPGGRLRGNSCTIFAVAPAVPMSVQFEVLWRYQGTETSVGQGTLDISRFGFSSGYSTAGYRGSNSSMGTASGPRPRPERYSMSIPNPTGPATTGTIVIRITKLSFDGAPVESFREFDLEFPNTQIRW